MKTGAVIVAAGMSSRMNAFKPLLSLGEHSFITYQISTLLQAGVSPIVIVTGNQHKKLEEHLQGYPVTCVHNPYYATTDMFHSVKYGLQAVQNHCDQFVFCPVDIPLYTKDTVQRLICSNAPIAAPYCNGKKGHPLLISASYIPEILSYQGDGGLKQAILACDIPITKVAVKDFGILLDADTPQDYQHLLSIM